MVRIKLLGFSSSLTRLNRNLVDGDISVFCNGLSALDPSQNDFLRLNSSLSSSQIPQPLRLLKPCRITGSPIKHIYPHSNGCDSLDVTGDFPTNLKWLWEVSLSAGNCNSEKVLQSMLQGNAIEDVQLGDDSIERLKDTKYRSEFSKLKDI